MVRTGRGAFLLAERLKALAQREAQKNVIQTRKLEKPRIRPVQVKHEPNKFSREVTLSIKNVSLLINQLSPRSIQFPGLDLEARRIYSRELIDIRAGLESMRLADKKTCLEYLPKLIEKFNKIQNKVCLEGL